MLLKSFSFIFIAGLLCAMLLFSSCSGNGRGLQAMTGFVGGNTGLKIGVMDGVPPKVVQGGGKNPFSFILMIENVGEAPVGPGTDNPLIIARLTGILPSSFGMTDSGSAKTLDSTISPARKNYDGSDSPGEISQISFENLVYTHQVFESLSLTIRAEVCYDYESYATVKFCMKKDVLENYQDLSICSLNGYQPVGSSGAPLHIAAVNEMAINNKTVQLNLLIEHLGRGVFFLRNSPKDLFDTCVFNDMDPNIYKLEVFVEPVNAGAYDISCVRLDEKLEDGGAHGIVRMYQGAPLTISCLVTQARPVDMRVYQDLLKVKLRYRYGEFLEVPILIQPTA